MCRLSRGSFRLFKLVRSVPSLRKILTTLVQSMASVLYLALLLGHTVRKAFDIGASTAALADPAGRAGRAARGGGGGRRARRAAAAGGVGGSVLSLIHI